MSKDSSSKPVKTDFLTSFSKSFLLIFGTVLLFLAGQLIGVMLIYFAFGLAGYSNEQIRQLATDNIYFQFLGILAIELVTVGALYVVHRLRRWPFRKSVGLIGRPTVKTLGYVAAAYGLYFIALIILIGLAGYFIPVLDVDQAQQLGFDSPTGVQLLFVFASLVILPSVAEEIIFRGFLFQRLSRYINIKVAALIVSLIFGAAHLEFLGDNPLNWVAAIDTFVFSIFLIILLVKTKSLWASILLHAVKNSIAFVFLFIL